MPDPTLWTARLAMLLYAAALACLLTNRPARLVYTAGAIVFLAHVAAAVHFRHHWSHAEALENVRRQTAAMTGVTSGIGLWLNYAFAAVWAADVVWLWTAGAVRPRSRWITIALHGFLLFMAVNATIVFPTGPTRAAGIVVGVALLIVAILGLQSSSSAEGR